MKGLMNHYLPTLKILKTILKRFHLLIGASSFPTIVQKYSVACVEERKVLFVELFQRNRSSLWMILRVCRMIFVNTERLNIMSEFENI